MRPPLEYLEVSYARSSGPGGQHVNKTESKVELRFHVEEALWIPQDTRFRFRALNVNRINAEGEFYISCDEHRSRQRNLETCLDKLEALLKAAAVPPKPRKKTKPSYSSKQKRLKTKSKLSVKKSNRSWKEED